MEKQQRQTIVEQLFKAALALPSPERASFLASSCGHDSELLGEVLSLLPTYGADTNEVQSSPPLQTDRTLILDQESPLNSGRSFEHYQILDLLGKGGMGEVYRARDTRLGRYVAIKFVAKNLANDEARLRRLEREARMLASVNHPNIATIYGLEYFGENRLLVMELVPGETLDQVIARGPIPIDRALSCFQQIAEALEAAHAKGLIHRDLKPTNIKLSAEGRVKLLDFGLGKILVEDSYPGVAPNLSLSESGIVMGTPGYMSPEQSRGQSVDKQTDIWAFACVLYEALSGERAFAGASLADVLANILHRHPDWTKLPAETPTVLLGLLRQCLEKEAVARPQEMSEVVSAIQKTKSSLLRGEAVIDAPAAAGLQDDSDRRSLSRQVSSHTAFSRRVRTGLSRSFVWMGALILILAGTIGYYQLRGRATPVPQLTNPIQVTRATGVEDYPTWSPDGATLAYESNEAGNWDIWVAQVAGGPAVNRTADHSGTDRYPSWSPDGRQIAFWSDRDGGGYYLMPALGGAPQRIAATPGRADLYHSPLAWAPDSSQVALATYKIEGDHLEASAQLISLSTRETREVHLPGSEEWRADLSWSPDGRHLAYIDVASQLGEVSQLKLLRFSDEKVIDLMDGRSNVRSPRWSPDGRQLFFTANRAGATDWWRLQINEDGTSNGEPERVTTGLEVPNGAFSSDGGRLAYSKGRWVSNCWRVPILEDRPATWADAEQLTFDQAFIEWVDVSSDGRQLAFSSDRSGNQDLWTLPIGSIQATQLTADPAPDWDPEWSPDGHLLAYYSYRSGDREIWVMPATGGAATQLTYSRGADIGPRWSPDGRQIVFRSERTGDSELWVMSADGTNQRQLTNNPAGDYGGTFSPDGKWITFYSNRSRRMQIWRIPSSGGAPELLSKGPGVSPLWAPDGDRIFFVGAEDRQGNMWVLSLKHHTERPLTNLTGKRGTIGYQFPSTDGKFVYFTWRDDVGDIWVMDVVGK